MPLTVEKKLHITHYHINQHIKHNKSILYFPANMFGYMNYKIENAHLARLLKIERTNTNRDFRFSQDLGEHAKVS